MRDIAAQWLDRQVRMGLPVHIQGMPESAHSPGFAVCAGLLQHALRPDAQFALPKAKAEAIERSQQGYVRRMGRWIAESF